MYNIVLIGAGSIGSNKPDELDSPKTKYPLTHAHALYNLHREKKVNWLGIVDINPVKLQMATQKWDCHGFDLLEGIKQDIDIIVIAVDTKVHYGFIKAVAIDRKPKIIIIEKPFCSNLACKILSSFKFPLIIEYSVINLRV